MISDKDYKIYLPGRDMDVVQIGFRLAGIMTKISDYMRGKRVRSKAEGYSEEFFAKFYGHFLSSLYLYQLTIIPDLNISFYDFASLNVLGRASLETFLVFDYLYIQTENSEEQDFRFKSWWRGGLMKRQSYDAKETEDVEKLKQEKEEIEKLTRVLIETDIYKRMSRNDRKKFMRGEWRFSGWAAIAKGAGFSNFYSKHIYSFLSGYAHTDSQSLIQLLNFAKEKDQHQVKNMRNAMFSLIFIVGVNFIDKYKMVFPIVSNVITEEDIGFLEPWIRLGRLEV